MLDNVVTDMLMHHMRPGCFHTEGNIVSLHVLTADVIYSATFMRLKNGELTLEKGCCCCFFLYYLSTKGCLHQFNSIINRNLHCLIL